LKANVDTLLFQKISFRCDKRNDRTEKAKNISIDEKSIKSRSNISYLSVQIQIQCRQICEEIQDSICFKDDLQMTHQNTYATTLVAKTFRALMIIFAAFDLNV
jgi:hypothetical protein